MAPKTRTDELAEVRRLAPDHRQQLRSKAAEIEDKFIVNDAQVPDCRHDPDRSARTTETQRSMKNILSRVADRDVVHDGI